MGSKYYENNRKLVIRNSSKRHDLIMFGGNKEKVLERDNFECQKCGMNNEQHIVIYGYRLIVHHKDGKGKGYKNPNNNLDNLITLCRKCHTSLHNKERIGNRNPNYRNGKFVIRKSRGATI